MNIPSIPSRSALGAAPESNTSTTNALGHLENHSIEQVSGSKRSLNCEEKRASLKDLNFSEGSPGFSEISSMLLGDPAALREKYKKDCETATPAKKQALRDAIEVLDAAVAYKDAFLKKEVEIAQGSKNEQQPFFVFSKALNKLSVPVAKNLAKLKAAAERVLELHALHEKLLEQSVQARAASRESLTEKLQEAAETMKSAIEANLQFAKIMKAGDIPEARVLEILAYRLRALAYRAFYKVEEIRAREEGRNKNAAALQHAFGWAGGAVDVFREAAQSGILKEEKNALVQAGNYQLQQAHVEAEDNNTTLKFHHASMHSRRSVKYFQKAARPGISEEEKNAWTQAGNYYLHQGQAMAEEKNEDSSKWGFAFFLAESAAENFKKAAQAGISEKEKSAWTQAGNYYLHQAQKLADGKSENIDHFSWTRNCAIRGALHYLQNAAQLGISQEERNLWIQVGKSFLKKDQTLASRGGENVRKFETTFFLAESAAENFEQAAQAGISEEEKNAWMQAANYSLQQAQAFAEEKNEKIDHFSWTRNSAIRGAFHYFQNAAQTGISQEERSAWMQVGVSFLQRAQAVATERRENTGKFEDAFSLVESAAENFEKAARPGISEKEKSAWTQAGNYSLQQALASTVSKIGDIIKFEKANALAQEAAEKFKEAAQSEITKETEHLFTQTGNYLLQKAMLHANDKEEEAKNYTLEAYQAEQTQKANEEWYQRSRDKNRPPVWRGI